MIHELGNALVGGMIPLGMVSIVAGILGSAVETTARIVPGPPRGLAGLARRGPAGQPGRGNPGRGGG